MVTVNLLASFSGSDGASPLGDVIADAAGNLFGVTHSGGAYNGGTVFEIAKTAGGYAGAPTILASLPYSNGYGPYGSLNADAAGNLFGTTFGGGAYGGGQVFEIAKTPGGYASSATSVVSFMGTGPDGNDPLGTLISDAAGNLFGTTEYGGTTETSGFTGNGTVFEIAKTATGYASAPTTLVSFNGANGAYPHGSLIADAAGNLFGTTYYGGSANHGTVFEIARTATGYASTPTTLVSFPGVNGGPTGPGPSLIFDAAGDLFGTSGGGGVTGMGTVFEIAKTAGGYAGAPTTLASFTGGNGSSPLGGLFADAAGDLFGTTDSGGAYNGGTVFEIAKTTGGYAGAPTTLFSFTGAEGASPTGGLIADAAGNLFGTTQGGGANGKGAVFEITDVNGPLTIAFTSGVDRIQGATQDDTFVATGKTLSKGDVAVGGSGTNVLALQGGGNFDLRLPASLVGIPNVDAQEGVGTAFQTITLRDGLNVTVNVASGAGATAGVKIIGANDASTINLGDGADKVIVGSVNETIHGGAGKGAIRVTGATIGATIDGGPGANVLELTTAGSAVMGSNITSLHHVLLDQAASLTANGLSGLTIVGSGGADTITAGGSGQTLTGAGGADTLVGWSGGVVTFRDTQAHLATATIQGFVTGDTIDLTDLKTSRTTPTRAIWAAGVLTVTQGAIVDRILLPGSFAGTFTVASDGKSGAAITYAAAPAAALMTQAMASLIADPSASVGPVNAMADVQGRFFMTAPHPAFVS